MREKREQIANKENRCIADKSIFSTLPSILKINIAVALFIILSLAVFAGDVIVQSGTINVGDKLYVDPVTSNVGIGTVSPGQKLDVFGGYIKSDTGLCIGADCRTSWPAGGSGLPSGTSGQTMRHDGTNWIASSLLLNPGADSIRIEKNNEVYLSIKNAEAGGKEYALVSAGNTPLGLGSFSIYDKTATADVSRLLIDKNGNIGIGTTTPGSKLSVLGTFNASASSASNGLYLDSSNNVGIGTLNPAYKLDVLGDVAWSGTLQAGIVPWARITGFAGDSTPDTIADDGVISDSEASDVLTINNGLLFAPTSGNVGIGITTPSQKLDVSGTIQSTGFKMTTGAAAGYVLTSDSSGNGAWQLATGSSGGWTEDIAGNKVYVTNTGRNVGIGIINPAAKLDVAGVVNAQCPAGMLAANSVCIETSTRAAASWWNAINTCAGAGRRLCSAAEWYYACSSVSGLGTIGTVAELVDDRDDSSNVLVFGASGCQSITKQGASISTAYRCCIDRKLSST